MKLSKEEIILFAEFMGYEAVKVGYVGGSDETEWQKKHEKWMDKNAMYSIGDYIANVKKNKWYDIKDVEYNSSWEWLMPVWEKIGKLNLHGLSVEEMEIGRSKCWIKAMSIPYSKNTTFTSLYVVQKSECKNLHEAIYRTTLEFIKWYNKNK